MLDSHDKLVARIERLLWHMGFFCRSNVPVDLSRWVPEESSYRSNISIADIDVLAIKYDTDFIKRVTIAEAKSGQLKPVDRILWLRGLMDYAKAEDSYLVSIKSGDSFTEVSQRLRIQIINEAKILEIERSLSIDDDWMGPFDPNLIQKRREFYLELKKTKARGPLYYVTFRAWEENPPHLSLKSVIGQGKNLAEFLGSRLAFTQSEQWLAYELLILFSLALLNYSSLFRGTSYSDQSKLEAEVKRTISHGRLSPSEMTQITNLFYELMASYVKSEFGKGMSIKKEELFNIEPPYASSLAEVVFRILNSPVESKEVPRAIDVIASMLLTDKSDSNGEIMQRLLPNSNPQKILKLSENNSKLFCEITGLKADLYLELRSQLSS